MEDRVNILRWMTDMTIMYKYYNELRKRELPDGVVPCEQLGRGIQLYTGIRELSDAAGVPMEFELIEDGFKVYFILNDVMFFQICNKTEEGDADVA